ncbi:MAG: PaaI family thioesterase [Rhizobiaceae bacterium]
MTTKADKTSLSAVRFNPDMAPPSARWMGMELIEHDAHRMYSKLSFSPRPEMVNFGGVLQGGFLAAMLDDAMGFNCFISLKMRNSQATIDLHTHYFKAVPLGPVTVEAWVVRAGRSVAFLEAKLYDETGELAVRATSSTKLRPFERPANGGAK